jgi:hypothetical protein
MGAVRFGPVFAFIRATDPKALPAFMIDHDKPHSVEPPTATTSTEFGNTSHRCAADVRPDALRRQNRRDPNMVVANLSAS